MTIFSFLDIARRLSHFADDKVITPPTVRLTFSSMNEARIAWYAIEREFNEMTLHPGNKKLAFGTFRAHGVDFIIEPLVFTGS